MKAVLTLLILQAINFGKCEVVMNQNGLEKQSKPERKLLFVSESEQDKKIAELNNASCLKSDI